MLAKEFFCSVRAAEHRIKSIRARRRKYAEMAGCISGMSESQIRSVSARSRTESAALRLVEMDEKLDEEAEHYASLIEQAESIIAQLSKDKHKRVLELRYLCGMSWRSIADEMKYSDAKSVYKVHGWALAAAQKIIDNGG